MTGKMFYDTRRGKEIEIGSFLELDLKSGKDYFEGKYEVARLNSGRSGIYHALKVLNCSTIHIPYYLCPDVKDFLLKMKIDVKYYYISKQLEPLLEENKKNSAVLIVNHFGILSEKKLRLQKARFRNVIIDNCASFFMPPIDGCYNIYSCRKFFGVPDGCYVIGPNLQLGEYLDYHKDLSSATSAFLIKRIELGCSAVYEERMKNEERINNSGVRQMSDLTRALMCSIDYELIAEKRIENFNYACFLFNKYNKLNIELFTESGLMPLFYPLVVPDKDLVQQLKAYGIYTGRRWTHVVNEVPSNTIEAFLTNYMVPIPLDQRYGREELDYCLEAIINETKEDKLSFPY